MKFISTLIVPESHLLAHFRALLATLQLGWT